MWENPTHWYVRTLINLDTLKFIGKATGHVSISHFATSSTFSFHAYIYYISREQFGGLLQFNAIPYQLLICITPFLLTCQPQRSCHLIPSLSRESFCLIKCTRGAVNTSKAKHNLQSKIYCALPILPELLWFWNSSNDPTAVEQSLFVVTTSLIVAYLYLRRNSMMQGNMKHKKRSYFIGSNGVLDRLLLYVGLFQWRINTVCTVKLFANVLPRYSMRYNVCFHS